MNGRLGMTGSSISRGDSAVAKMTAKNMAVNGGKMVLSGAGMGVGMAGASEAIERMKKKKKKPTMPVVNKGLMSVLRGKPKIIPLPERPIPKFAVKGGWRDARLDAREEAASDRGRFRAGLSKVDTTMDEHEAGRLAGKYDTRGPLPKGLDRATKMKAYEARYIASGGKKGEKWKRQADMAERGRNIGLAGATTSAAAILALRGKHTGPALRKIKITPHRAEAVGLGSAVAGGTSELYGEHARHRRASYQNSPAGVAGSALTRMQNYTKTPGVKR